MGEKDLSPSSHTSNIGANVNIAAHDEALQSMMSFFSHCHKVENDREI